MMVRVEKGDVMRVVEMGGCDGEGGGDRRT